MIKIQLTKGGFASMINNYLYRLQTTPSKPDFILKRPKLGDSLLKSKQKNSKINKYL